MKSKNKPLFRAVIKPNSKAQKVLFFIASYKATWHVYAVAIQRLRRAGYEVVVYDLNDYILDNDDPTVLLRAVHEINEDISARIKNYKEHGIQIFDAFGNSLGSFMVYNYAIRYPLRKIVLNTGGYMSRIIFGTKDRRLGKTRKLYEAKGYDPAKLEEVWHSIDSPPFGRNMKAKEVFMLTSLKDKHITNAVTDELIGNMAASGTKLLVDKNRYLSHSATVLKNAHSSSVLDFLLRE